MTSKGFTLIEILVVMALFALIATMVFSSVGKSRLERRNRDFSRSFVGLVKRARTLAVSKGAPVSVRLSDETKECRVEGLKGKLTVPEAMLIEAEEGGGRMEEGEFVFSFYPDGSSDGLTLTLTVEDVFKHTVRIDMLTGIVTRSEGDE